jgi:hypothetical protein
MRRWQARQSSRQRVSSISCIDRIFIKHRGWRFDMPVNAHIRRERDNRPMRAALDRGVTKQLAGADRQRSRLHRESGLAWCARRPGVGVSRAACWHRGNVRQTGADAGDRAARYCAQDACTRCRHRRLTRLTPAVIRLVCSLQPVGIRQTDRYSHSLEFLVMRRHNSEMPVTISRYA